MIWIGSALLLAVIDAWLVRQRILRERNCRRMVSQLRGATGVDPSRWANGKIALTVSMITWLTIHRSLFFTPWNCFKAYFCEALFFEMLIYRRECCLCYWWLVVFLVSFQSLNSWDWDASIRNQQLDSGRSTVRGCWFDRNDVLSKSSCDFPRWTRSIAELWSWSWCGSQRTLVSTNLVVITTEFRWGCSQRLLLFSNINSS